MARADGNARVRGLGAVLLAVHVVALAVGAVGLLVAVPHAASLFTGATSLRAYAWASDNVGTIDILTGAAAMFAIGLASIGFRRTLVFAVAALGVSTAAELIGTSTGWPFGGYTYTGSLGWRIAGRLPYAVPLSWFYMGLASFLVARAIVRVRDAPGAVWSIALGAALLTSWDLVLDPALASASFRSMHYWVWREHGPYFGMPLRNLAGWFGTGLLFMTLARLAWRGDVDAPVRGARLPLGVYVANVAWATALALAYGLWTAGALGIILCFAAAAPASVRTRAGALAAIAVRSRALDRRRPRRGAPR
jgi:uncharacterized membrane protein